MDIHDFLVDWIDEEYQGGASISGMADALSGLHHYLPWSSFMAYGETWSGRDKRPCSPLK